MITLIGTGHVFDLSQALLEIFKEVKPDILCVELDKDRYNALILKQTRAEEYKKQSKDLPILYKMIAKFQNNVAGKYGVKAGDEMIATINYAKTHDIPLAFIDKNAQTLFVKMLKSMSIVEKIKVFLSGLSSLFVNKDVEKELKIIEKDFDKYMKDIERTFPTIKKVLVDERNKHMVERLTKLDKRYKNIVAVVGDGHIPGMSELMKKKNIEFKTLRLKDLRDRNADIRDTSTASFSLEYKEF